MKTKVALTFIAIVLLLAACSSSPPAKPKAQEKAKATAPVILSVPSNIPSNCSTADGASSLANWLNGLPANSSVKLPPNACYNIATSTAITGTTGLTIDGNGAVIHQTTPIAANTTTGLLYLRGDTNLTVENLNVYGALTPTCGCGGVSHEGAFGIFLQGDHTVSMSNLHVANVQGDFIILKPQNPNSDDQSLSTNVSIVHSRFDNAGYHGLTIEAVNGLTIKQDIFIGMGVDAIDAEYDVYSSAFDSKGNAIAAAEDNVTIAGNFWGGWQGDFYASLQGQSPGVQEDNVLIENNWLNAASPLFEVTGTNPYLTPSQYWNKNLVISGNFNSQAAISTHGAGPPGTEATMQIQGVVGLTITGNTLPISTVDAPGPYLSVLQAFENQSMWIGGNNFSGAYNILQSDSAANYAVTQCANKYGVGGSQVDSAC